MSAIVIVLIVLGLVIIISSYVFADKMDKSQEKEPGVIEIPDELSEEQKDKIQKLIDDCMNEKIDSKLDSIEKEFSKIVNDKTLALGDYAVTVNEEIEKNHKEVVFMYDMLQDKQKEIMTTATMVDDYRKDIEAFVQNNDFMNNTSSNEELAAAIREIDESLEDGNDSSDASSENNRELILELHKQGLSILEIAKQLGLGVGEVKLVVDLYQGAKK